MSLRRISLTAFAGSAALIAAITLGAVPSQASPWTGCYVGGSLGYSVVPTETTLSATGLGSATIESLSAEGVSYGVTGGCDLQVQRVVLGAWADHQWDDADFNVTATGFPTLLTASMNRHWAVGGRAGYLVKDGALAYVLAGYSQAESSAISSPAGGFAFAVPTLDGYVVGAGTELPLGKGLYLDLRYSYTDYESTTIPVTPGFSFTLDPDVHNVKASVIYRFSFDGSQDPLLK